MIRSASKMLLGPLPGLRPEERVPGRIAQKLDGVRGHVRDVADGEQIARLAVDDDLGQAADVGGDHGDAAVHGLEGGQAEALLLAGQEKQVGAEKEGLQLVLLPEEMDVGAELQLPDQLLDEAAARARRRSGGAWPGSAPGPGRRSGRRPRSS